MVNLVKQGDSTMECTNFHMYNIWRCDSTMTYVGKKEWCHNCTKRRKYIGLLPWKFASFDFHFIFHVLRQSREGEKGAGERGFIEKKRLKLRI